MILKILPIRIFSLFLVVFIIAFSANNTSAQDTLNIKPDKLKVYKDEKLSINFGGFLSDFNSEISLTADNLGAGIVIDLEDALDLESTSTVLRASLKYTFGKTNRHAISMGYFSLARKSTKVFEYEFEFGDFTYPVGTEIYSKYNFRIIKGSYDYSFYKDDRVNLSASLGLFVMPIKFSFSTPTTTEEAADFIAPLPVIGLHNSFAITPKVSFIQNIDILYFKISYLEGYITDFNALIEYKPIEYIGLGMGLNTFNFNMSLTKGSGSILDFNGKIKTGYTGLLFYAKFYI